jgi:hypothetical protein
LRFSSKDDGEKPAASPIVPIFSPLFQTCDFTRSATGTGGIVLKKFAPTRNEKSAIGFFDNLESGESMEDPVGSFGCRRGFQLVFQVC